jgi:hypothetical protein
LLPLDLPPERIGARGSVAQRVGLDNAQDVVGLFELLLGRDQTNHEDRIVMERHSESPPVQFEQILMSAEKIPYDCPREELKPVIEAILRPTYAELRPLTRS